MSRRSNALLGAALAVPVMLLAPHFSHAAESAIQTEKQATNPAGTEGAGIFTLPPNTPARFMINVVAESKNKPVFLLFSDRNNDRSMEFQDAFINAFKRVFPKGDAGLILIDKNDNPARTLQKPYPNVVPHAAGFVHMTQVLHAIPTNHENPAKGEQLEKALLRQIARARFLFENYGQKETAPKPAPKIES